MEFGVHLWATVRYQFYTATLNEHHVPHRSLQLNLTPKKKKRGVLNSCKFKINLKNVFFGDLPLLIRDRVILWRHSRT